VVYSLAVELIMRFTGENKGIALTVTAAASLTASAAILLHLRQRSVQKVKDASTRERYLPAIQELAREFFHISRDVAEVAKRVRRNVMEKGLQDQVTDAALRQQLTVQCKVLEKLEKAQEQVASSHQCSADDIRLAQEQLQSRDPEVSVIAKSFQTMLNGALGGEEPIFPGISIPSGDDEQQIVLDLYVQIHSLARQKVYEHIQTTQSLTMQQLAPVMEECHNGAVSEVLSKNVEKLGNLLSPPNSWGGARNEEVYYSGLSACSRIPAFVAQKEKEDESFKQKLREMLSLGSPSNGKNSKKS